MECKQSYPKQQQQSSPVIIYKDSTELHDPTQHFPEYLPQLPGDNDDEDDDNEYMYTNEEDDDMYGTTDGMNAEVNNHGDQDHETETTKGRITRF